MYTETVVGKWGSGCLVDKHGIDQSRIDRYAAQVAALDKKYGFVVVTSGAVAVGKRRLQEVGRELDGVSSQALAALGSASITEAWQRAFARYGMAAGQVLVTHREIRDKHESSSLTTTMRQMLDANIVPIVNANDALEQDELKKLEYGGDNDWLAADLAIRLGASELLLLTSGDGFVMHGEVQSSVRADEISELGEHFYSASQEGTGSMESKLKAAALAARAGVDAFVGNAQADYAAILGNQIGTQVIQ